MELSCYRGKRVLITGHTGFKGAWLCEWLIAIGAEVYGYALEPPTQPSLFGQLHLAERIATHVIGDVRDAASIRDVILRTQPDFIFHLAAQPIVRLSYQQPVETFAANTMGTVHLLDACRFLKKKVNVVCITTDKCYENRETSRPYQEEDPMGGHDPYSCSKGCAELVISSYRRSFFGNSSSDVWVASARAGNVIGGGDWALDRIVPDCMRAIGQGVPICVRNKGSTRPWQHVLDPLCGYLTLGAALSKRENFELVASGFNFGPDPHANRTVGELVNEILKHCKGSWNDASDPAAPHEAHLLGLDIRKAESILRWSPTWGFEQTVAKTVEWYGAIVNHADPIAVTQSQLVSFMREGGLAK